MIRLTWLFLRFYNQALWPVDRNERQHSSITIPISQDSMRISTPKGYWNRILRAISIWLCNDNIQQQMCLMLKESNYVNCWNWSWKPSHSRHWHKYHKHNINNRKKTVGNEKKIMSRPSHLNCSLIGFGKTICSDFAIIHDQSCFWLYKIKSEIRIRTTGWFLNQLKVTCHDQ